MALLTVKDLNVQFNNAEPDEYAVKDIDFTVEYDEIVGIVGESGSGKSVTAMSICGLVDDAKINGTIEFDGRNILSLTENKLREIRGNDICMIFQEPMSSMNPLIKVGRQIEESLKIHKNLTKQERYQLAINAMKAVELNDDEMVNYKYPHELSGGMLQRCMIASCILTKPKLLIADEPTTALDVTIQSQIIELLKKLNKDEKMAIMFISHDLNVVKKLCSKVVVMKSGRVVETGNIEEVFNYPCEEYTKKLISAIPTRDKKLY